MNIIIALRRLKNNKSLRIVNLLGLSLIFSSILLSYNYVKKELSYDRFNEKADRIVRMSLQFDGNPIDGRQSTFGLPNDSWIEAFPEIENVTKVFFINTGVLTYNGKPEIINDFFVADSSFTDIFTLKFIEKKSEKVLNSSEDVIISKSLAVQLFGNESAIDKEVKISGRKVSADITWFISGVYEDFPETSHFHPKVIMSNASDSYNDWAYYYFLLEPGSILNIHELEEKIGKTTYGEFMERQNIDVKVFLTPLTDIHLKSHVLREMEQNGNIYFIYLIVGANILLLFVVLFNLWLNSSLIFSFSKKYYQLLRLNGGSKLNIIKDETFLALLLGISSVLISLLIIHLYSSVFNFSLEYISNIKISLFAIIFIMLILFVSLLPVIVNISLTIFNNINQDLKALRFSFSDIKYMLIVQYCIVVFMIIITFVINRQMEMIQQHQMGAGESNILALYEQPNKVQESYELLKSELEKYSEIEMVTACMQLPGSSIRDGIEINFENEEDKKSLNLLYVTEDFLPFFKIMPVAGKSFSSLKFTYKEESEMMKNVWMGKPELNPVISEEYLINMKALQILGFDSPEEAIGQNITINHSALDYIKGGKIVGVVDDFNYATVFEESVPLLIMQRSVIVNCIMIRLNPENIDKALAIFDKVWSEVNPDFPADYSFLQDTYNEVYKNEINADILVSIFSLLCLVITGLGLIIFTAFVVKSRSREIAIRKVNGATIFDIIKMLNKNVLIWVLVAFIISIPCAYFTAKIWLENFIYKISLEWWIFVLAGIFVFILTIIIISIQSLKIAMTNPVNVLKSNN
ncbi:MAG: hypothetical protein LBQ22_06430 [Bacteroidales bacterium]|jgi:putative ABC transport system permease protein|nr:hypothetical protein [Bacteroidales bacterium]